MKPLKIIQGLFLGDYHTSTDLHLLKAFNIIAIANIGGGDNKFPSEFEYKKITMRDSDESEIINYLDDILTFINNHRKKGNVLVHCKGGICRSACFIIAYLTKYNNMSVVESFNHVKSIRKAIRPREKFITDINKWIKTNR